MKSTGWALGSVFSVWLWGAYGDNKGKLWSKKVIGTKLIINHRLSWISAVYCNQTEIITTRGKHRAPSLSFCCWFATINLIIDKLSIFTAWWKGKVIKACLFLQTTYCMSQRAKHRSVHSEDGPVSQNGNVEVNQKWFKWLFFSPSSAENSKTYFTLFFKNLSK